MGTVFIDQSDTADTPADADAEQRKQDCELNAFLRLAPGLRLDALADGAEPAPIAESAASLMHEPTATSAWELGQADGS